MTNFKKIFFVYSNITDSVNQHVHGVWITKIYFSISACIRLKDHLQGDALLTAGSSCNFSQVCTVVMRKWPIGPKHVVMEKYVFQSKDCPLC
jgi:hypothetical protein